MKELTLEKAYELAVQKWQYIVDNDGSKKGLLKKVPELKGLRAGCSYCELFYNDDAKIPCAGCPINIFTDCEDEACTTEGHPYNEWNWDETKANAQAVLDLIIKTKPI